MATAWCQRRGAPFFEVFALTILTDRGRGPMTAPMINLATSIIARRRILAAGGDMRA
jgi:hypothetical protein